MQDFELNNLDQAFALIFSSGPVLLLLALVLDYLLPLPKRWQAVHFYQQICLHLATKVNRGSIQQQKLAGSLLCMLLWSVCCLCVYLLEFINLFPSLFHLLLLYICLRGGFIWRCWKRFNNLLKESQQHEFKQIEQQKQAKQLLQAFTLRKVDKLSAYGLQKAGLEAFPQQLTMHWFAIIAYFLLFDIQLCIFYVLVCNTAQIFNRKMATFKHFGWLASLISRILCLPIYYCVSLSLILYGPMKSAWRSGKKAAGQWHFWGSGLLLGIISSQVHTSLGGPRIYPDSPWNKHADSNDKQRYPRLQSEHDRQQLQTDSLFIIYQRLAHCAQLWLCVLCILSLFTLYFRLQ